MESHAGHRQRLKKRFLETRLDGFDDLTALELLLFYALPRQDTRPIAKRLLERYGSLAAVLEASVQDLQQVEGVGPGGALLLTLVPAVAQRYLIQRTDVGEILNTTERCGAYLLPRFFGERDEVVWLLCLDGKCKALDCRMLFRGSVNAAGVSVRKIVETALACNAAGVVLAHNHVSGIALPSREDVLTTQRLKTALNAVDICLVDHLVIAGDDFVSMADSKLMD